jgi:spermidine synthase
LPLIRRIATPFGPVSILRDANTGEWIYKQGGGRQSESDGLGVSTSAYIHAMFGLIAQRKARRVLCIGCAAGSLATMLHAHGARVTAVDINPGSFDIARQYFSLADGIECVVDDGARFLRRDPRIWDAIALDAYDGHEIPNVFLTPGFARLVREKLEPKRGLFLANVFLPWPDDTAADAFARRLGKTFKTVRILDESHDTHRNCIVAAGAVSRLQPPTMTLPPACAAGKVFAELAGFRFV